MLRMIAAGMLLVQAGTAAMAAPPPRETGEKAADPGDKIVCKRFLETGSLVKGQRICKTKAEWQRDRDAVRATDQSRGCASVQDPLCR